MTLTDREKLVACAVLAVAVHAAFARSLGLLPARPLPRVPEPVKIRLVTPPPPPPEPPPIEAAAPPPEAKPAPKPPPPARPERSATTPPPQETPPAPAPSNAPPSDEPEFGFSMESASAGGTGPAISAGTPGGRPGGGGKPAEHASRTASEPVPDYAVTTAPMPQGRCIGKYTDDARTAGIEGVVVLDLVVGEDGRVRDLTVTQKLGHGLDEAAIAALRACRFSAGEKDGQPVAVRIHGFKIRFVLAEAE